MKVAGIYTRRRTWRRLLSVLPLLLLGSTPALVRGSLNQTDEDIVNQFFPEFLIEESEEDFANGGPAPFRASAFGVADLDGTGTEFIVAAYTNGFSAAIRVLRRQGATTLLVDEPALRLLGGIFPFVRFIDIDNDGRLEVVTSFTSARGRAADWVFKWNGTALDFIGPLVVDEQGDPSSVLIDAAFLDLDGDGILEVINSVQLAPLPVDEQERERGPQDIFTFDGERYVFSRSVNFIATFIRTKGKPVVIGPRRFNQRVARIVEKVNLLSSNLLTVELRGAPGSQLIVIVAQEQ